MPSYATTTIHALRKLLGTSQAADIDAGIGALADDIDAIMCAHAEGLFVNRGSSATRGAGFIYRSTDAKRYDISDGTTWTQLQPAPTVVTTSLPASPIDGQECYLRTDGDLGGGVDVVWHLRYNASQAGSYKWDFIGGGDYVAHMDNSDAVGTSAGVELNMTDIQFVAPIAGDYTASLTYNYRASGSGSAKTLGYMQDIISGTNYPLTFQPGHHVAASSDGIVSHDILLPALTAGRGYQGKILGTGAGATGGTLLTAELRLRPLRLG